MRKALIGILMAATMATPLAAQQNEGWRGNRSERSEGRSEQRQQRQEQRQARQEAAQQQQQAAPQQQAPQQQAPQRQWSRGGDNGQRQQWQGNNQARQENRSNWQGRGESRNDAYRQQVEQSREASRRSAEGVTPGYARQAERNQQRYEQQLRRDYQQQGRRGDRYRDDRRDNDRSWNNNSGNWRGDRGRQSYSWNRGWRNDNRYDWQRYRYSNRNIFRGSAYYAPYRNYSYNRLGIGAVLDSLFFGRNYWISDPYYYHLPPSPAGTQWVRYYNDVVLVDVYSGEVLDVIEDFFW